MNAPLSFDGAFFLFRVLEHHQFATDHGRYINLALQAPVMFATYFTENIGVLRILFCATFATVPLIGLLVSWIVCRAHPELFVWPAMSICIGGLPGQFSFHSEATMVVTLLWPALLAVLVNPPAIVLAVVALTSAAALFSHPYAGPILAFIVAIAITSAILRPESRKESTWFAVAFGILMIVRLVMKFDPYEGEAFGLRTVVVSFNNAVIGWPMFAMLFTIFAAVTNIVTEGRRRDTYLLSALSLSAIALVIWALYPTEWAKCNDYRYWNAPVAIFLMGCAAIEVLWLRRPEKAVHVRDSAQLNAILLMGVIFLAVISLQSCEWYLGSRRVAQELATSDRACISSRDVPHIQGTALDFWSLGFYAIEMQGRVPRTLILPHNYTCHLFSRSGDAALVQRGAFVYTKHRGDGWFDFEDARSRMRTHGRSQLPGS